MAEIEAYFKKIASRNLKQVVEWHWERSVLIGDLSGKWKRAGGDPELIETLIKEIDKKALGTIESSRDRITKQNTFLEQLFSAEENAWLRLTSVMRKKQDAAVKGWISAVQEILMREKKLLPVTKSEMTAFGRLTGNQMAAIARPPS